MHIVVFITAKDKDEAQRLAQVLVEEKLVACVNIVPAVESLFWWEGKVDRASEVLLILKSKRSAFRKILQTVKKHHSYHVPEVIALPIIAGNKDYLEWIDASVR